MNYISNGVLHLPNDLDNEQIEAIVPKINNQLDNIRVVTIDHNSIVASSALFSLLYAIKKEKEDIQIQLFETSNDITLMGNVTFI